MNDDTATFEVTGQTLTELRAEAQTVAAVYFGCSPEQIDVASFEATPEAVTQTGEGRRMVACWRANVTAWREGT